MLTDVFQSQLNATMAEIRGAGLLKHERIITSPQRPRLSTSTRAEVQNLCANNYLGLASHPEVIAAAQAICDLAERYEAMVMVDDSHAVGFMGAHGRGTHEHHGVMGRVDIITGTLGKALGGPPIRVPTWSSRCRCLAK